VSDQPAEATPDAPDAAKTEARIYVGDCLDALRLLPDASVDLIVTSPPYADARAKTYGGIKPDEYVAWFLPRSAEFMRVLKPTGSFVLNIKEKAVNGERHPYVMYLVLALRDQGWKWIEEYMWHKKNSFPGKWPNRFRDGWEHLYHFTREKKFFMDQDAVRVPVGDWADKRLKSLGNNDVIRHNTANQSGFGKNVSNWVGRDLVYPNNVLHLASESSNTGHSAAFPEELPSWFIKLFCPPNGVVLDPFVGSGTTCVAAHRLGRNSIGVELLLDHVPLIRGRLEQAGAHCVVVERGDGAEE
jgi:DNA modification methylase